MKKRKLLSILCASLMVVPYNLSSIVAEAAGDSGNGKVSAASRIKAEKLQMTEKWDKVFPQSNKVNHRKVTFVNRYGITLAADMYEPKKISGRLPAIAVSGPFGAVKEQSSGLYAQEKAHSRYFGEDAFRKLQGDNKELLIVPGANHTDLYDRIDKIPFDKMEKFFRDNLQ